MLPGEGDDRREQPGGAQRAQHRRQFDRFRSRPVDDHDSFSGCVHVPPSAMKGYLTAWIASGWKVAEASSA
jgi:hypothetical protein